MISIVDYAFEGHEDSVRGERNEKKGYAPHNPLAMGEAELSV